MLDRVLMPDLRAETQNGSAASASRSSSQKFARLVIVAIDDQETARLGAPDADEEAGVLLS
jgi:CHASE2 domain-containing sensor protein